MNIFKLVHFHFLYYVVAFIVVLTGYFKEFIVFNGILMVHEFGHVMMAYYFKWNIDRILILPFGAVTIFHEKINRPIYEEFLIAIAGIVVQMLLYIFLCSFDLSFVMYEQYHWAILLFNLLPIYPLDGSKIFNLILCRFFPFCFCHMSGIFLSIVFLLIFFIFSFDFVSILIGICLVQKLCFEIYYHRDMFQRFLLERYLYDFQFRRRKYFDHDDVRKMMRGCSHLFYSDGKMVTEKEILRKRFDFSSFV